MPELALRRAQSKKRSYSYALRCLFSDPAVLFNPVHMRIRMA